MSLLGRVLKNLWQTNQALSLLVLFSLACLLVSLSGLVFDPRLINGEHAWIKPCKFSISLAVYGLTAIWLSTYLTKHLAFFKKICGAALVGTVIELGIIIMQVVRGTTSHFNNATPFNHAMFLMAVAAIMPVALSIVALFVMLLREDNLPPVMGLAIRWGVFLTIIGLIPGVLMVLPDPVQDALTSAKQFDGHTVGLGEGGPGLPFLGWSTIAGDLRIAHFVGIHALQILPLIGWAVSNLLQNLSPLRQKLLVWNAGGAYLSVIFLLTWQALQAESIVGPSAETQLFGLLIFGTSIVLAAGTIWLPEAGHEAHGLLFVDERLVSGTHNKVSR